MPIPAALTPLLGRARELDDTERLLGATRLLTITGAGGSGKTRLALELAHRVADDFLDGVVWVDLAPLSEPDLIAQQILGAMGLREFPALDVAEAVIDRLRDRSVLLVFDNCEHLIHACAVAAESILRGCPNTSILATSREPLGIPGEQTWLVPPLAEPDAVQLFLERARSVDPAFRLDDQRAVAQICNRLDGIPLAIELAAARVKVLSVEQIANRLDQAFRLLSSGSRTLPRHRTIRETIDWSYRLLAEHEQVLLRRLAVFGGSFGLAAAEAICGDDALESLSALVDKSLVLRGVVGGEARYRLLETVRQFAAEKLVQSGEQAALRERHARYFADEIERAEPRLFAGAVDPPTMARIDQEIGNVRAAIEWMEEDASRAELELRLMYALHWYWFARGHFHEARKRIEAALARAGSNVDPHVRARALVAFGDAAVWQADWKALRPPLDEAVETLRTTDDLRPLAEAQMLLGTAMAFAEGNHGTARQMMDEAVAIARRHGRDVGLCLTLYWSGLVAQLRDDLVSARAAFEEGRRIGEELGNKPAIGHLNAVLGHALLEERKFADAITCFRRALEVQAEIDDRWGLTHAVEGIGIALLDSGDAEAGTRLLAAASAAWLQLGARPGRNADFEQTLDARLRQALGNDRLRVVLASGAAMPYDEMVAVAREHAAKLGGATPTLPSSLRVRALGALELERDGLPIDAAQSGRARELLLYLLCHPAGATKEQIGAALWPDIDPDKLRNNFHVTIHRLRKILGAADWVVASNETYSLKPGIDFDAARFEREAREAMRAKDDARLSRAVELYRGDFFANATSGEWHDEERERLRELYASALTHLGRAYMLSGDFAAAAEIYQRLVALDDLDEQACRNLMTCLSKAGDPAAAARAYRRLEDALRRELQTEPDPATTRIYERVTAEA